MPSNHQPSFKVTAGRCWRSIHRLPTPRRGNPSSESASPPCSNSTMVRSDYYDVAGVLDQLGLLPEEGTPLPGTPTS
jgi:hypothetical protein